MLNLGPFCFRNSTEEPVDGLHVTFNGTGGTLTDGIITVGPPGRITANSNQINVLLNGPLAPGMPLCFTVAGESQPISIHSALWSRSYNIIGKAETVADDRQTSTARRQLRGEHEGGL
jgi:hypothetical protein